MDAFWIRWENASLLLQYVVYMIYFYSINHSTQNSFLLKTYSEMGVCCKMRWNTTVVNEKGVLFSLWCMGYAALATWPLLRKWRWRVPISRAHGNKTFRGKMVIKHLIGCNKRKGVLEEMLTFIRAGGLLPAPPTILQYPQKLL